jgi:hypothetical protein
MNFNLASPSNNGNEFTIQFKEPISIAENSKIKLNFAELVRDKEVILTEDAELTMSVNPLDMIPTAPPAAPNAQNLPFNNQTSASKTLTIAKGDYTFVQFRDKIEDTLILLLAGSNLDSTYEVYVDNDENEAVLTIGIMPVTTNTRALGDMVFSATHEHDATNGAGGFQAYTTNNAAGAYDNYAIADNHFNHYIANSSLGAADTEDGNLETTTENNAYIYAESIKTISDQSGEGNIFFGLYSAEYANGIGGAPPTRTNGNNPPVLSAAGIPRCFVGVELTGDGQGAILYYAKDAAGNLITTWNDINREIGDMYPVARIPLSSFTITDKWKVILGTEIDNTANEPKIRVKVGSYQGNKYRSLWDSQAENKNLPYQLMVGNTTVYDNANALNSQIPFNVFASVKQTQAGNGFEELQFKEFDKTTGSGSDANPNSYVKKINILLSTEVARAIGVRETLSIRPNQYTPANKDAIVADLDYTWKKNNYSILLDLPLNNFKNRQGTSNTAKSAAIRKQVLANIPAAFATGETIQSIQPNIGNAEVITVYQPYNVIQNSLKNNPLEINSMSFHIVDMMTEQTATEIKRSVINFTIE